jgi:hypothetical protein
MSRSALEASQRGNTQHDRTLAAEKEAREKREEERKTLIAESGNNPMSKKYIAAFDKNKVDETPTGVYVKATRYGSPSKTRETSNCEGSSCTMSGGKRRKSRKQRGSRKNKKSRRR